MWLFGYGSLIWKADFPYKQKQVGYIKGFERRFYQYSTDHRGTEENRRVWGVAYEIDDDENGTVWSRLDFREKNGYTKKLCKFYPKNDEAQALAVDREPFELVVYIGDPDNKWYAGEASAAEIAESIISGKGKSGFNLDYLRQLAHWMRKVVPEAEDPHLFDLENVTLHLMSSVPNETDNGADAGEKSHPSPS